MREPHVNQLRTATQPSHSHRDHARAVERTNVALAAHSSWYASLLGIQVGFYCAVAGGWAGVRALRIPFYFVVANLAILVAWFRYARGERMTVWKPSERPPALPQVCVHKGTF